MILIYIALAAIGAFALALPMFLCACATLSQCLHEYRFLLPLRPTGPWVELSPPLHLMRSWLRRRKSKAAKIPSCLTARQCGPRVHSGR